MASPQKIPVIQLTKPAKKGASGKTPKLEVGGLENKVVEMRKRLADIESLEAQQKLDEEDVLTKVKGKRLAAEADGDLYKTALVNSGDGVPAKVTFKNQFKQISTEHEEALRTHLKTTYDTLFTTRHDVKLRDGVSIDQLKELLGDKLGLLFDVTPYIGVTSDFMEKRAALRRNLDKKTNAVLDSITEQAQYRPSISLK
jgi:hypothetical protein